MNKKILWILLAALLLRLVLAPLTYHGDVLDSLNWGKNLVEKGTLGFYFRDTPDAGPPNYPPLFYLILLAIQYLYLFVKVIIWKINLLVPVFPSNLYLWLESDKGRIFFNKIPSIFADLGIGYYIYRFVKELKNKVVARKAMLLFLFLPPTWYLSAVWGQTESLFMLPLMASIYFLYKKKITISTFLLLTSLLMKPTAVFLLPVFAFSYLGDDLKKKLVPVIVGSLVIVFAVHYLFLGSLNVDGVLNLYRYNIREVLGYLTANAFNIWSFFFGFSPIVDNIKIVGISAFYWGFIFYVLVLVVLLKSMKVKQVKYTVMVMSVLSFGIFLLMTRMHERYFYLAYTFLALTSGFDKKIKRLFILSSFMFLVNLYHFWWVPKIDILVGIFSTRMVEQVLVLINFLIFYKLVKIYKKNYA